MIKLRKANCEIVNSISSSGVEMLYLWQGCTTCCCMATCGLSIKMYAVVQRALVILKRSTSYGGRALIRVCLYCMRILSRKTNKQVCGSRIGSVCGSITETMQKRVRIS